MPFEQTENQIRNPLRDASLFVEDSFRTIDLSETVHLVIGKLKANPDGPTVAQSLRWDVPPWTLETAKQWFEDHKGEFVGLKDKDDAEHFAKQFKAKHFQAAQLFSKSGVEVFSAGVWNGDPYTVQDLDAMVEAFNETSRTVRPHLKLGHTDNQKLLQSDGLPAAGWIGRLYRQGEKLLADFVDIPKTIFQLIENKAYRNVSSEIFWNLNYNGRVYKRFLSAVALLGADTPGVGNLKDILALYGLKNFEAIKSYAKAPEGSIVKTYSFEGDKTMPSEAELKLEIEKQKNAREKAEADAKKFKADSEKNAEFKKKYEADQDELKKLRQDKADSDRKAAEAQVEKFVTECESELKTTKAMRPYIKALVGDEKKEYSIEKKNYSKQELVKEMLKLFSSAEDTNSDDETEEGQRQSNTNDDVMNEKIEKYAADNKVSYSVAYRAVMKEQKSA